MKPVTVAGAGLAGLTLGNALQRAGVPTTLHEAHSLPRHRVCGEFICGRGADALRQLDLAEVLTGAKEHRQVEWTRRGRSLLKTDLPVPAYGISRHLLDRRLAADFLLSGGSLQERSRLDTKAPQAGTVLCHGRRSHPSGWIGLKLHTTDMATSADLELHLGENGYIGLCAVEGGRVNVCGLFKRRPGVKARKSGLLLAYLRACNLQKLAERLEQATIDPDSHVGVAGIQFSRLPEASNETLCLGDAYSVIPPFTGNGMSIALESAQVAYPEVLAYARGEADWPTAVRRVQLQLSRRFDRRLRAARRLHPWLHHARRQSALAALVRLRLLPFNRLYQLTH